MNFRPGVSVAMITPNAYGASSGVFFSSVDGNTMIASAIGSVASMRAPRITSPESSSLATRAAMNASACCDGPTARLLCGVSSECVRQRSCSRSSACRRTAFAPKRGFAAARKSAPGCEGGQRPIQVIRSAAHHAVRVVRRDAHRSRYALELAARARIQKRAGNAIAARRRFDQAGRGLLPLDVVELGQRCDAAAKRGMRRHVGHGLALIPQRRRPLS